MATGVSSTPRTRIQLAKESITIPVLWRKFNLPGKPAKSCRSPLREDLSPSFSVSEDGLHWIDFATGDRGDSIDFFARVKGINPAQAFVEFLDLAGNRSLSDVTVGKALVQRREEKTRAALELADLEICTEADLLQISQSRSIPIEGLRIAAERRLLFSYENRFQGRCWAVTDDAHRNAICRRLDGKRFHFRQAGEDKKEGPKSRCWNGSQANWPIGITQATGFPAIALCEGAPDFLAAFALAYAGGVESLVAAVCMTGATCRIHEDALGMFRGKRVRIFGHVDKAGSDASIKWAQQLRSVQAEVDGYDFTGLLTADGRSVQDLNDFLLADTVASGCAPAIITGAFDFGFERRPAWQA